MSNPAQPILSRYEYRATRTGGIAIFHWSDGTITSQSVTSQAEAMALVEKIQQSGSIKPESP
jgi:hypothetical protein